MKSARVLFTLLASFVFSNLFAQRASSQLTQTEKYYIFTETGSEIVSNKDSADYYAVFFHPFGDEWKKEGKYEGLSSFTML